MRIAMLLGAAATAALVSACGLGAPSYPTFGEADYRIEGMTTDPNGARTHTVIYRDGPKMRVEAMLPNIGQGAVVFDESTNAAYVLNPTGQGAMAAPGAAPAASAAAPAGAPATAPSSTTTTTAPSGASTTTTTTPSTTTAPAPAAAPAQVVGVAVRVDDTNAPQPMEAAWSALGAENARHVGECTVAGENGNEWRPREESTGARTACITDDGIVLRVSQEGAVLWEATSLQRGEQDVALFGVPAGYQVIDPQAVAEQVGENLEQLDSVTGAPPAPQQAPAPRG